MKQFILFIALIGLCGYLVAQENTWEVYLRGQAVKSIDFENNYVWAATDNFLVRINKLDKSATYYTYPYDDKNGSSYKLKIDKNGIKWIGRSEYLPMGQSIYERYSSSIYSFDENQWSKIKSIGYGQISSLVVDKQNNKWLAKVGDNGLYKIETDSCIQYTPQNSGLIYNNVRQVASDKDGNIWMLNIGNYGGLLQADIELIKNDGNNWISIFSGRGFQHANMSIDSQGNPWVQNLFLLSKLDTISKTWSEEFILGGIDSQSYYQMHAIEGEHKIWCTRRVNVQDKGIAVYSDSDWNFYTTSDSELPSDTVYQITIDADGTKWIATENGLAAFNEIGLTTSTDSYSKKMNDIELFPNPANDFIILKMPGEIHNSTVDILNIQGKIIKSLTVTKNQNKLNINQFPSGIYLVRIQSNENQILKKFVKQ